MRRLLLALAPLALAACGPPWAVIQQSGPPSALRAATQVTVFWDPSEARVDGVPIAEARAALPPAEQAELDSALRQMGQTFVGELSERLPVPIAVAAGAAAPGEVRLVARPVEIQRGARSTMGPATELTLRLEWMVGPDVVDTIQTHRAEAASLHRPSASQRLRIVSAESAHLAADFFERAQAR